MITNLVRWITVFAAVFGISRSVQADLMIDNPGFEDVPLAPGGYTYSLGAWVGASANPWISNGYYDDEAQPQSSAMVTQGAIVFQDLTNHTFQAGTTYIFSMDTGARTTQTDDQWSLRFYDATAGSATTPLIEATGTTPIDGAWHRVNVAYTATPAEDGSVIGIAFGGVAGGYYNYYDNAVVVPEPSSVALLLLGGVGVLVMGRRKSSGVTPCS